MEYFFREQLANDELEIIINLYNHASFSCVEQHPEWPRPAIKNSKLRYFLAKDEKGLACYAIIREKKDFIFSTATIEFGPVFRDSEALIMSVKEIHSHYRKSGYMACFIQLAMKTGASADYIEALLNKEIKIKYKFDRSNWSSIELNLSASEEALFSGFSENHRRSIKKAIKNKLQVTDSFPEAELASFIQTFIHMNQERKLDNNPEEMSTWLRDVYQFIKNNNAGAFLLVKDEMNVVLGGIVLLYQSGTIRYFKGAADPAFKQIPVLHLAFWEAIKRGKQQGFQALDFWGYNHYVSEGDQVFNINRFKKGFGGELSFYPKKMYIVFKPFVYQIYQVLYWLKKRLFSKQ